MTLYSVLLSPNLAPKGFQFLLCDIKIFLYIDIISQPVLPVNFINIFFCANIINDFYFF